MLAKLKILKTGREQAVEGFVFLSAGSLALSDERARCACLRDSFQKVSPRLLGNEFHVRPLSLSPSLFPHPSHYASKNNFKLLILLPLPPYCTTMLGFI